MSTEGVNWSNEDTVALVERLAECYEVAVIATRRLNPRSLLHLRLQAIQKAVDETAEAIANDPLVCWKNIVATERAIESGETVSVSHLLAIESTVRDKDRFILVFQEKLARAATS